MDINLNNFLNKMKHEDFLQNYWQKQPKLFKQAVPEAKDFATTEDLIDMAFDEDFETRMIIQEGGKHPWELKHGPLTEEDFDQSKKWTLVCHGLNLFAPEFYALENVVSFIPKWQFDDVMATYSLPDATVGAHIDNYDVFILQGTGKRKWQLQLNPDPTYQEELDVRLLKNFNPDIEWILEPGDMIYIPAQVAHYGVSLEESISYSIGFRSIIDREVIDNYFINQISLMESNSIYQSAQKTKAMDPFQISEDLAKYYFEKIRKLTENENEFKIWLTSFLSRPKNPEQNETKRPYHKGYYFRDTYSQMCSLQISTNEYVASINGQIFKIDPMTYQLVQEIFNTPPFEEFYLEDTNKEIFKHLIETGVFFPAED